MNSGLEEKKRVAYFQYDFSVHGGAAGDITINGDGVPKGAIIDRGLIHVITAVTGGTGATVALKAIAATDIKAATAVASFSENAVLPVKALSAASHIRASAAFNEITLSTATATAITAGKFTVALEYFVTDQD